MAAKLVFALSNNFTQKDQQGICTASSLNWAKRVLLGRSVERESDLVDASVLNIQMAKLRRLDSDPAAQCALVGLIPVGGDRAVSTVSQVVSLTKASSTGVSIFWTAEHTMGYRYKHLNKEFFDQNRGFYRAKKTKEIAKELVNSVTPFPSGIVGMRIVALDPS